MLVFAFGGGVIYILTEKLVKINIISCGHDSPVNLNFETKLNFVTKSKEICHDFILRQNSKIFLKT